MGVGALEICVLAGGVGRRLGSRRAKAGQLLGGRPLLGHLLDTAAELGPHAVHVVVGKGGEEIKRCFQGRGIRWVAQPEALGTGHAVMRAATGFGAGARVLICLADTPLVRGGTLRGLLALQADLALLTVELADPTGYGRVVREGGRVTRIVEEKDASAAEKRICEVNSGIMAVSQGRLKGWLGELSRDNAQGEYLLPDIVALAHRDGATVGALQAPDPLEAQGVNTYGQLSELERAMQQRNAKELMAEGVQLMDPARFDLRGTVKAGRDVRIDINVILEGEVVLGDEVVIGPNVVIRDSRIGAGAEIKANSVLEGAVVGAGCSVGPFARLRPGTVLAEGVGVGNFVEIKKSSIGKGSKANHLAYLGDSTLGEGVNVGAGTITCNYDGVDKHETHIGDGAFIGSNAALVAPVKVGAGATVGAGSTITQDVEAEALAVGRGKQRAIAGWHGPRKAGKSKPSKGKSILDKHEAKFGPLKAGSGKSGTGGKPAKKAAGQKGG